MIPTISVIIPYYNAEPYLAETVNSVFQQTFTKYEIIIIDDGSQDHTRQIIESFGSKVQAEYHPNRGVSVARNRGTQLAQGQFIQYLDADDLLRPNALEKRVNALLTTGADVAYSDWQRLEEQEGNTFQPGEVVAKRIEEVHSDPQIALFTQFWAPPAALLYRHTIVRAIGGWNETLPIIQDARFLLDAALVGGKFVYIPGVGADYRVHRKNSLSRRNPVQFVEDCYRNACQVEAYWTTHGGLTLERCAALAQVYDYTARTFFAMQQPIFDENLQRLYFVKPGFQFHFPKIAGLLSTMLGYSGARMVLKLMNKLPQPV